MAYFIELFGYFIEHVAVEGLLFGLLNYEFELGRKDGTAMWN